MLDPVATQAGGLRCQPSARCRVRSLSKAALIHLLQKAIPRDIDSWFSQWDLGESRGDDREASISAWTVRRESGNASGALESRDGHRFLDQPQRGTGMNLIGADSCISTHGGTAVGRAMDCLPGGHIERHLSFVALETVESRVMRTQGRKKYL